MRQIISAFETMRALCGQQAYSEQENYRSASFSLTLPIRGGFILYHSLTGEMLTLTEEELQESRRDSALRKTLVQKRFLVPEAFDERAYTDQVRQVAELLEKKKGRIESFKIFTTTDCNARCFYCYEMGRRRVPMSDETAHAAAAFISRESKGHRVTLDWFGGEPLFHQRPIEIITADLREAGIEYVSAMISNGYLFDRDTIEKARDAWRLQRVQITLDGTERVYNQTKAYPDAEESPYRRVMRNISMLLDAGIKVRIRLNMHKNNAADLRELIGELSHRISGRRGFSVYLAFLQDAQGSHFHFDDMEALEAFRRLNDALLQAGLRKAKSLEPGIRINYCIADDDASITILPEGQLGKCEHFSESEFVGSIDSGVLDADLVASWKEKIDRVRECGACPCYPRCNRLKKCVYSSRPCSELDRALQLDELKERIYTSYARAAGAAESGPA